MRAEFIGTSLPHAPFEVKGLPYRPRRTVGDLLLEALMALAEAQASLLSGAAGNHVDHQQAAFAFVDAGNADGWSNDAAVAY